MSLLPDTLVKKCTWSVPYATSYLSTPQPRFRLPQSPHRSSAKFQKMGIFKRRTQQTSRSRSVANTSSRSRHFLFLFLLLRFLVCLPRMAASTKGLSVLLLALVLAHSQVQARESKFFSKVTHSTNVVNGVEEKKAPLIEIPAPAPEYSLAPGPAPAYVEKEYGYGLYGHDSDMLPPARETYTPVTTTTTVNVKEKETTATPVTATTDKDDKFEEQFVREELSGQSFQTGHTNNNNNYNYYDNNGYSNNYRSNGYANTRETNGYANNYKTNAFTSTYSTTGQSEKYNTNGNSGNYNNNGHGTERQGMSDTRYMENGKYSYHVKSDNSYLNGYEPEKASTRNDNTNGYSGNYNNNGYGTERQGMSDTRYMENGKYSFHVKSDNSYLNGYEPEKASTGNYVNYDEKSSNQNEFDTMEEYYKKQGYQESQEVEEP
ncbi:hypothetical protein BT93_A1627 [Corymbia citriodora subsp. variegata]|nr:hypothetical protein BT93_A1627 [Corymbia citriodora subsp. variegata]